MPHTVPHNLAFLGFNDPFSSMTHLLGALFFFVLGVTMLLRHSKDPRQTSALLIFIFAVVFMLSMSGVYHLLPPETTARLVLQRLDHAAIFFLIAASFTPVHMMLFRGFKNWGILAIIWIIAITGITLKSIFFAEFDNGLGLLFYLSMGWTGLVTGYLVYHHFGLKHLAYLVYGAIAYTTGAVLDFIGAPVLIPNVIEAHELFHLMVLLGVTLHWLFVFRFVVPFANQVRRVTIPDSL